MSGRVLAVGEPDTVPVDRAWVTLHQITLAGGAPVDSSRTDRFGVYFLVAAHRDTSALYVSSVEYQDISYFSAPVSATEFTSDTAETLFVFDTSSVSPLLMLAQRHVVVRAPDEDGSRPVLELVVLRNEGRVTRIAGDESRPVWAGALPPDVINLEVGEGDVSPETVVRRGNEVALVAPVPPGQKQLVYAYTLPSGAERFEVPVDQFVERLQVLFEDTTVTPLTNTLERRANESMDQIRFARFEGRDVPAGQRVAFEFTRAPLEIAQLWWIVVLVSGLAFFGALAVWWRRLPSRLVLDDPNVLAARIAALDEAFEAKSPVADEDRLAYERNRGELRSRLAAALARRNNPG